MGYKKTHKKINKIKLKKNNKSKRKYKKKGAGQRLSRGRRTRNQTPSSELHDLQGNVLPQADVTIPPTVPVITNITNISNADKPIVKTYSKERINTVKAIMKDFGFNDLIDLELKKELKSALLDYVRHGDNLITVYYTQRSDDVEDKIDDKSSYFEEDLIKERKIFVPGELRVLVKEWNNWRKFNEINLEEAIKDLIETLKTPEDTDIMYDYGNH